MRNLRQTGLLLFLFMAPPATAAQPMIGLVQEESVPNTDGQVRTGLRLAFVKASDSWSAICDDAKDKNSGCKFDASMASQWIVSMPGRQVGRVTTKGWLDNDYSSETGLLKIISGVPSQRGNRGRVFSGWNDNPVYPPLVATSMEPGKTFRWNEVYPEKMAMSTILPVLERQVGALPACRSDAKRVAPIGKPRVLALSDVHVFETSRSIRGELIVGASIKHELVKDCDYTGDSLADVWFYDDGKGRPRPLPALIAKETMHSLIAIGDFAGDGQEEALFWLSGYNEDGFVLLYDHFRKAARFSWSYN